MCHAALSAENSFFNSNLLYLTGQCAAQYSSKYLQFHVVAPSSNGWLLHHQFIRAELEELYLVNSKTCYIVQIHSKALKDTKV